MKCDTYFADIFSLKTNSLIYPTLGEFQFTTRRHLGIKVEKFKESPMAKKLSGVLTSLLKRCQLDGPIGGSSLLKLRLSSVPTANFEVNLNLLYRDSSYVFWCLL